MAYEQIAGPLGGGRGDFQAALVASAVVNVHRDKGDNPIPVSDFMPEWDQGKPKPAQTWEEQYDFVRQLNRAFGGTEV